MVVAKWVRVARRFVAAAWARVVHKVVAVAVALAVAVHTVAAWVVELELFAAVYHRTLVAVRIVAMAADCNYFVAAVTRSLASVVVADVAHHNRQSFLVDCSTVPKLQRDSSSLPSFLLAFWTSSYRRVTRFYCYCHRQW